MIALICEVSVVRHVYFLSMQDAHAQLAVSLLCKQVAAGDSLTHDA